MVMIPNIFRAFSKIYQSAESVLKLQGLFFLQKQREHFPNIGSKLFGLYTLFLLKLYYISKIA